MLKHWSISNYNLYKQCPKKYFFSKVMKIPEPKGEALLKGIAVHDKAENYLKGAIPQMPEELALFARLFRSLKRKYADVLTPVSVEDSFAFTVQWRRTSPTDWNNCWLRVKVDACETDTTHNELILYDWKTGKFNEKYQQGNLDQLELYALAGLLSFPHIKAVRPKLFFLEHGVVYPLENAGIKTVFFQDEVEELKTKWEGNVAPMFTDKTFACSPGPLCRFCHYRKDNKENGGGQCEY